MKVLNVHERQLEAGLDRVGALIDAVSSPQDRLWPKASWPNMQLDRPLGVGARGGHGPIRYVVEAYEPGRSLKCRFTSPSGFDGFHLLECMASPTGGTVLRHTLEMNTHGPAVVSWPLLFRPLHDALIEDGFSTAAVALGEPARIQPWNTYVKVLRWLLNRGNAGEQRIAGFHASATEES